MRLSRASTALFLLSTASFSSAFAPAHTRPLRAQSISLSATVKETAPSVNSPDDTLSTDSLSQEVICKLRYRELKHQLENRSLSADGTTSQLRDRLRKAVLPDQDEVCVVNEDDMDDDCVPVSCIECAY
jgi:hypothetical protein